MDLANFLIQTLNSVQYGLLLFLLAAGLTLIFGIMGVVNLAHGSFYMIGAYLGYGLTAQTGNLALALAGGATLSVLLGWVLERLLFRHFYHRDHLDQVLMTFGLIYVLEESRSILWGDDVHGVPIPDVLSGAIQLTDNLSYPHYRLFISAICLLLALGLYLLISKTRIGMRIRAGAFNSYMTEALGINIRRLHALVFALGVGLAAVAGILAAPISSVYPNMGSQVLIMCFVVVVIGGIGSVRGALIAAILVGLVDTFGKVLVPGIASMLVYALMAAVLIAALWLIAKEPALVSATLTRVFGLAGATAPAHLVEKIRTLETSSYAFVRARPGRLMSVIACEASFHVLSVAETWITLAFLGHRSLALAFVLDTVQRVINVVFRVVPLKIGVDEVGSGLTSAALGYGGALGVTMGVVSGQMHRLRKKNRLPEYVKVVKPVKPAKQTLQPKKASKPQPKRLRNAGFA